MTNQGRYWDDLHRARRLTPSATGPSDLAQASGGMLRHPGLVLELGCGSGRDARYFHELGHSVVATDISPVALHEAKARGGGGVAYVAADTASPLPGRCERFDLVYSRLSLHYFTDSVTRQALSEISRVLKPGGAFVALFRSTRDPLHARGTRLEQDMYALDGHVRRFVDPPYLEEVATPMFDVEDLSQIDGDAFGYSSSFTRLVARKRRSSAATG
ncbi:class I SAM-dependent methyltransferase [Lentzea sp. NPDC059081]|uniref:class I SAM-dependent methyltransferase n=1 Tax=Lentzea sp. NPDC059081 TaxID=3346719 RepID=UPI00368E7D48